MSRNNFFFCCIAIKFFVLFLEKSPTFLFYYNFSWRNEENDSKQSKMTWRLLTRVMVCKSWRNYLECLRDVNESSRLLWLNEAELGRLRDDAFIHKSVAWKLSAETAVLRYRSMRKARSNLFCALYRFAKKFVSLVNLVTYI